MTLTILSPDEIDFEAYAGMQRASFAELLRHSGVPDDFMSPQYYSWKYRPPAGNARIAMVVENGEMVASTGMFPLKIAVRGRELIGWQFCDAATVPKGRSKGYFTKCIQLLQAELKHDGVFFGFPNKNSKGGFDRIGWRETQTVATFARVIPFARPPRSDDDVVEFDPANDAFNARVASCSHTSLVRNADYIRWRYLQHPSHPYTIYFHRVSGGSDGYVVLREIPIAGRRAVLLMELHASSPAIEKALLRRATYWGLQRGIHYVLMLSNYFTGWTGLKKGFVLLPSRCLPKQQVLMGSGTTQEGHDVMGEEWLVQTGDWDGF